MHKGEGLLLLPAIRFLCYIFNYPEAKREDKL